MKNLKKLSAMLMASIITAGTVSSMSASAILWVSSKEYMDKQLEGAYLIPNGSFMSMSFGNRETTYLTKTDERNVFGYYSIGAFPDRISTEINADIDDEALKKAIAEICPQAEYIEITPSAEENYRCINVSGVNIESLNTAYDNVRKKDLTYEQVLEIYNLLDSIGELQKYEYKQEVVYSGGTRTSLTTYSGKGDIELIENYIAENNLDWYIDYYDTWFEVAFEKDLSPEECYKIAEQIYNDLGVHPSFPIPSSDTSYEGITIEMHNNIKGDANDDGELSLSDAVAILQSIGNPDEYQLTPQGKYNADVTGDYDGITNKDALTIQRRLLGLE